ncbi:MAG: hypothetical protein ABIA63_10820 [bacterium]
MEITKTTTASLNKQLLKLKGKVDTCFPLLKGSVTIVGGKNKQPRFSVNKNGKRSSTYLGKNKKKIATKYVDNYNNLIGIIREMTDINLELIRRMEVPRVNKSV